MTNNKNGDVGMFFLQSRLSVGHQFVTYRLFILNQRYSDFEYDATIIYNM